MSGNIVFAAFAILFCVCLVSSQESNSTSQESNSTATSSIHQTCGETIRDSTGFILSPNYPLPYDPNTDCEYRIVVEEDRSILVRFAVFDVEYWGNCMNDRLVAYNGLSTGSLELGSFCGSFRPPDIISTSNKMLLKLVSDTSKQGFGFYASYTAISPQLAEPGSCGGVIRGITGKFNSPNFPKSYYPNDQTCVWHIKSDRSNHQVVLKFHKFHIEYSEGCAYDSVTVYGKSDDTEEIKSLGKFCKLSQIPDELVSSGNQMYVIFSSDSSGNNVGFSASYETREKITTTTAIPKTKEKPTKPLMTTTSIMTSRLSVVTSQEMEVVTEEDEGCGCYDATVAPCNSTYYAIFGRVGRVKARKGNQPLNVQVIVQKILKMPTGWSIKRKTRINLYFDCPECYPEFRSRGKIVMQGNTVQMDGQVIINPDMVNLYSRKEYKNTRRVVGRCGKKKKRRRRRNRGKRGGSRKI